MTKLDLHIGVPVHGKDKHCGRLSNIVVDPETQEVTSVIVEQGLFLKSARVIPISAVTKATATDIQLDLNCGELADYATYQEIEIREPAPEAMPVPQAHGLAPGFAAGPATSQPMVRKRIHDGVAAGSQVLGRKTEIAHFDSTMGALEHVVVDSQSGKISEIMMRRGIFPTYHLIPAGAIENVREESIRVSISDDDLVSLPRYEPRPDAELLDSLVGAMVIEDSPAFKAVEPTVDGGVAHLSGEVPSEAIRRHAEELARLVPGVIDVENYLVVSNRPGGNGSRSSGSENNGSHRNESHNNGATNGKPTVQAVASSPRETRARIRKALYSDPKTKDAVIEVIMDRGVVTLQGEVKRRETRMAAETLAARQPGVLSVVNELVVA